jgi:hypothetical protein
MTWTEYLNEKNELYLELLELKGGLVPPSFLIASQRMTGNKNFDMSEDFLWPRIVKSIQFLVKNRKGDGGMYFVDHPMTFKQYMGQRSFYQENIKVLDIL